MQGTESQSTEATLRRIDTSALTVGDVLPAALRDEQGHVLLPAGRVLQERDLDVIGERRYAGVFGTDDWPPIFFEVRAPAEPTNPLGRDPLEPTWGDPNGDADAVVDFAAAPATEGHVVIKPVERLRVGERLSRPLYTGDGVLLLAAGMVVTHGFLARLRQQGVYEVQTSVAPPSPAAPGSAGPSAIIRELDDFLGTKPQQDLTPNTRRLYAAKLGLADFRTEASGATERYAEALERVADVTDDLLHGRPAALNAARGVVGQFLDFLRLDAGLLPVILKLKQAPGEYLYQHALNVAAVSVEIAGQLSLPPEQIVEIGLGALLQDIGMLRVPEQLRLAPRALTPDEQFEVRRHPIHSLDFLERQHGLSKVAMMIAYQVHERGDCSGYPRGRHRLFIHPFARLVAAADTYVAMTSHRPYRAPVSPYQAMVNLLHEVHRCRIDCNVMRNMLDCMSLFPVGSYVRLSDGTLARVWRANPGRHTSPTVVPLNGDGSETDVSVDLSRGGDLRVVQALPGVPDSACTTS
ncbi:MAG TPA: HD domain-containing phosphohydrolase [Phycisphaerae bacterium]|nr:HD domain-containing phosphohydrolase [Phycisphaerae bacterium]HNU44942.1 HD domain-containing phosphohydrolase [Phycisphaerae bacterium]